MMCVPSHIATDTVIHFTSLHLTTLNSQTPLLLLLLQTSLLDTVLRCVPSNPACPLLPGIVIEPASMPIPLIHTNSVALRAVCAMVGWCAEGWLFTDSRHLRDAASSLTMALRHYCEHPLPNCDLLPVGCDCSHYCEHPSQIVILFRWVVI
jgi:hypothetical protein